MKNGIFEGKQREGGFEGNVTSASYQCSQGPPPGGQRRCSEEGFNLFSGNPVSWFRAGAAPGAAC